MFDAHILNKNNKTKLRGFYFKLRERYYTAMIRKMNRLVLVLLVILDVVCRYLSLFVLYINGEIGKIDVKC